MIGFQSVTRTASGLPTHLKQLFVFRFRIQNLVRSRQQDKQNMATIEKKLADEQKLRAQSEQQLAQERKQKKVEDSSRSTATAAK